MFVLPILCMKMILNFNFRMARIRPKRFSRSRVPAMIVCHCKAVSDRTIRQAVREGACSFRDVALQCNAGRSCGGCRPAVVAVIEAETETTERSVPLANAS